MNTRDTIKKHWNLIAAFKNGHKLEFYVSNGDIWIEWSFDYLPNFNSFEKWRIKTPKF